MKSATWATADIPYRKSSPKPRIGRELLRSIGKRESALSAQFELKTKTLQRKSDVGHTTWKIASIQKYPNHVLKTILPASLYLIS